MKRLLIICLILFSKNIFSQNLNIGGNIGTGLFEYFKTFSLGGLVEYKAQKPLISITTNPFLIVDKDNNLGKKKILFTEPLYIKLILGNNLRFCPLLGGFIRTNKYYGWFTGFEIEYKLSNKLILFFCSNLYCDYLKKIYYTHWGDKSEYIDREASFWLNIGIKQNILMKKNKIDKNKK